MQREVNSDGSDDDEQDNDDESDSDEENSEDSADDQDEDGERNINMKFDGKSKSKGDKKSETKKGILGLKFMERAEQKEKEALKAQVNLAAKEIRGEDDYVDSDDEDC